MNAKVSKVLKYVLSALLAVALLWFAFGKLDWKAFWEGLKQTKWIWVIASVLASLGALWFREERWRQLLLPLDPDIRRIDVWDAYNFGNFFSVFIPGVGEVVRVGAVAGKKATYDKAFGTIVMERAWDLLAVAFLFILAVTLQFDTLGTFLKEHIFKSMVSGTNWIIVLALVVLVALGIGAIIVVYRLRDRGPMFEKIAGWIDGALLGFKSFAQMKHKWLFLLNTVAIWLMYILMSFFVFKAMPELSSLGFSDSLLVSAVGNLASVVPVPGGLGAYHYLVALSLSSIYEATWEAGILFATLTHESRSILLLLVTAPSYLRTLLKKRK